MVLITTDIKMNFMSHSVMSKLTVFYFANKINPSWVEPPLKFDFILMNLNFIFLVIYAIDVLIKQSLGHLRGRNGNIFRILFMLWVDVNII